MITSIEGVVQHYDWGRLGNASKVAVLASASGTAIQQDKPYAELWMGTHPSGPATVSGSTTLLKTLVNEETLGKQVAAKFVNDLPFLFKVLSIRKALSIQAHPDKPLAEQLHAKFPDIYKDPNHKPEMAVALTDFEAFIGFRPLPQIAAFFDDFPEFQQLIGEKEANAFKAAASSPNEATRKKALQQLFSVFMSSTQDQINTQIRALVCRVQAMPKANVKGTIHELLVRLNSQFPDDIGCFCAFLLNYVKMVPGEAIFLAANEPHAYLSGDCIECMAASDNVVRSGLTPKFKDVNTLVNMLTYNHGPADAQILRGEKFQSTQHTLLFNPPIEEFSILLTSLSTHQSESVDALQGPSILIVTSGHGSIESDGQTHEAKEGSIFFIGAGTPVVMKSNEGHFVSYRAFCEVN